MVFFTWIVNIFKKKSKVTIEQQIHDNEDKDTPTTKVQKDPFDIVINDSVNILADLKIFVNYFGDDLLDKIHQQTNIVHDVFSGNRDLNYKKLEQFHYYYTAHLLELLRKLKKKKDEKHLVLNSQIKAVKDNYTKNKTKHQSIITNSVKKVDNNKAKYAEYISLQLTAIYNCLVSNLSDFRYKTKYNLHTFVNEYGIDLAWNINSALFQQLTEFDKTNQYVYQEYTIERKLLGKLQKNLFKIQFIGVVKLDTQTDVFELYKIAETDDYFIFIHDTGIFKFINFDLLKPQCIDSNTRYGRLGTDLLDQENKLKQLQFKVKENTDASEIHDVLEKYLATINGVELLDDFSKIDVERQNLQSILDLTRLEV